MRKRVLKTAVTAFTVGALLTPAAVGSESIAEQAPNWRYELQGVSADAANDAWAVGWRSGNDGVRKTLVEHWDGRTWATVPSPNRSPLHDDVLTDVAALSPTDVWAVGLYRAPAGFRTLTLHWDGERWHHVPSPSGHHFSSLRSISAVGPDDIWAVGSITKHYGQWYRGLIEHWDGTSWSIVDSTTPRRRSGLINAVSAVSHDDIWASAGPGGGDATYSIYRYDGEWTPQDIEGFEVSGRDISMDAPNDGWAVGAGTMHWDGSSWTWVAPPLNDLRAVSAISPTDAWVAGAGTDFGHWDGTRWTKVPKPSGEIYALDARTTDDIWAVGHYNEQARIEHWDGASWTVAQ
jgi:hypothetical protein